MSLAIMLALWAVLSLVLIAGIHLFYRPPEPFVDLAFKEAMDIAESFGWLEYDSTVSILSAAIDPDEFDPTDLTKGGGTIKIREEEQRRWDE